MNEPKIIALYLPQFHPIPENDEWWGKGFTEWTNVGKAKPLFKGHYQPRIPKDLGYYDLRLPEIRTAQADLANKYGVDGFCYYHYWFGRGKQLLERPFNDMLQSGKPDFPFMLCWANESWHAKFWNHEGVSSKKVLIKQLYGDIEDNTKHFYHLIDAFKDSRYIKIEGKPLFMIYKPLEDTKIDTFLDLWQSLAKENGLPGIHFIGQTINIKKDSDLILSKGFDSINPIRTFEVLENRKLFHRIYSRLYRTIFNSPSVMHYKEAIKYLTNDLDKKQYIYPSILPNWDHTPRSGRKGFLLHNSTPEYFRIHVRNVFNILANKSVENQICFIKSWNEWGEGNYMEPDIVYGNAYLEVLKSEKDKFMEI